MRDSVQEYYGQTLQSSADLATNACCDQTPPAYLKPLLANIHDDVLARYYGCGLVVPDELAGARVLDLGCGAGRDVYLLSQLVGEPGEVVGVDMTDEQLAVARQHEEHHRQAFGYGTSNVRFEKGYLEALDALELARGSFDVVISNCVINLSTDKPKVLADVARLLKPGGEFYFSDVYADRRLAQEIVNDPVLYGECLGGALYWNDFEHLARRVGFGDPRLVESRRLSVDNVVLEAKLGNARFYSATYRLFNIADLEPACEDYGQAVIYRGTVATAPHAFTLDGHHVIEAGRVFPVCGNTWRMLAESRFAPHFEFIGDFSQHFGVFAGCGVALPFDEGVSDYASGGVSVSGGCC